MQLLNYQPLLESKPIILNSSKKNLTTLVKLSTDHLLIEQQLNNNINCQNKLNIQLRNNQKYSDNRRYTISDISAIDKSKKKNRFLNHYRSHDQLFFIDVSEKSHKEVKNKFSALLAAGTSARLPDSLSLCLQKVLNHHQNIDSKIYFLEDGEIVTARKHCFQIGVDKKIQSNESVPLPDLPVIKKPVTNLSIKSEKLSAIKLKKNFVKSFSFSLRQYNRKKSEAQLMDKKNNSIKTQNSNSSIATITTAPNGIASIAFVDSSDVDDNLTSVSNINSSLPQVIPLMVKVNNLKQQQESKKEQAQIGFEFRPKAINSSNASTSAQSLFASGAALRSKSPGAIINRLSNFARGKYRSSLSERSINSVNVDEKVRKVKKVKICL